MSAQARKIHRILDVQQQLYRIEEWKLADLERTLERLAEAVDRQVVRAADKTQLLDIIERFVGPAAQASRKIAE